MEEEMPALEYARLNGLSWDYKAERSALLELERIKFINQMQDTDVLDDSHLRAFEFGPEMRVDERLVISKEAALLIQSVTRSDGSDLETNLNLFPSGEKRTSKEFQLELPLLLSDHEKDCRDFGNKDSFEIKIQDVNLPLEVLDDEKNKGLNWSSELWNYGPELIEKIKQEKFCVSKETLSYLQEILRKDSWTFEDAKSMWISEQMYQKTCGRNLVTPPLSPRESSPEPYQPSSSDSLYQIPLLSDPSSPTDQELKKLESGIFKRDVPTPIRDSTLLSYSKEINNIDHVLISELYLPLESYDDPDCLDLVEAPRVKRESLRVDETLTPQASATRHVDSIELKNLAEEQIHDVGGGYLGFEDEVFDDVFLPAYEVAIQNVEQEDLIEVNANCRVNIPNMDFSKGDLTWKTFENATKDPFKLLSLQKSFMRECFGVCPTPWTSSAKIEPKLRWSPFPQDTIDIVFENENFEHDDSIWKDVIPEIDSLEIIDSSGSVWKRPGLRILRDYEASEDEVEYYSLDTRMPCNTGLLLKKRKAEIDEKVERISNNAVDYGVSFKDPDSFSQSKKLDHRNQRKKNNGSGLLLDGGFSACNAVENYLKTRGSKVLRTTKSSYFDTHNSKSGPPDLNREKSKTTIVELQALPRLWQAMLPVLSIDNDQSRTVIIASKVFASRLLIKTVEKLLPKINIFERDFSTHNSIAWTRGSVVRSPVLSPISCEADVIISPVTGVILTTLQKIKQKPLPGQKSHSALRELLISISLRYEKILVLVSEDRVDECTIGLDARDCLAWSEFVGFTISLDSLIVPKFIGGGQETLAQWLVSYIVQYGTCGSVISQNETNWEIFLRRAGLNPFAAQAVIADLKAPNNSNMSGKEEDRIFGLVDFIGMSAEHRMKRFSHLVGECVLERVSRMIDRKWSI